MWENSYVIIFLHASTVTTARDILIFFAVYYEILKIIMNVFNIIINAL